MKPSLIPRARHPLIGACALLCSVGFALQLAARDLTAEEVMRRSQEAMKPPIRYEITTKGVRTIIFQNLLSDGTVATRVENFSPVPKIALQMNKESYEFYPERGVGIDTSLIHQSTLGQATAIAEKLGNNALATSRVHDIVRDDGRNCFEVITTYSTNLIKMMTDGLPEGVKRKTQSSLPTERRMVVDKATFVIVEIRTMSQTGAIVSLSEFRAVERPASLPDDLFLPPDGIELLKPRGREEYVAMVAELLRPVAGELPPRQELVTISRAASVQAPRKRRIEIDPRTGSIFPSLPAESAQPVLESFRPPVKALTAPEVLRRAEEAMKPPIRYQAIRDGVTSVVDQIGLAAGVATRLETNSPNAKVILVVDDASCEFYPARNVGIDTSFLPMSLVQRRLLADSAAALLQSLDQKSLRATKVKVVVPDGSRECFEIIGNCSFGMSDDSAAAPADDAPVMAPRRARFLIDKSTYELVEVCLISEEGVTITQTEFKAIERTGEQWELFLVPDGIDFTVPHSIQDYAHLLTMMAKPEAISTPLASAHDRRHTARPSAVLAHPRSAPHTEIPRYTSSSATSAETVQRRMASTIAEARATKSSNQTSVGGWLKTFVTAAHNGWPIGVFIVLAVALVCNLNRSRTLAERSSSSERRRVRSLRCADLLGLKLAWG